MPIRRLAATAAYSPEQVAILGRAFEAACVALGVNREDRSAAEAVATQILEYAAKGEFDPDRLKDYAVHALRGDDSAEPARTLRPSKGHPTVRS
jgi:hypothetical protein